MSKVAYEKGNEVHPNVGANERRFVSRRTASPDRGHLSVRWKKEEVRTGKEGRPVSQARGWVKCDILRG